MNTECGRKSSWRISRILGGLVLAGVLTGSSPLGAQAEPESPVRAMRNKISAGDVVSAESILEVYRHAHGEDKNYLTGIGWLARGALLVGDHEKAQRYSARILSRPELAREPSQALRDNRNLRSSYGAAVETRAGLLEQESAHAGAIEFLRHELSRLDSDLVALRSRLYKRLNRLQLVGQPAPSIKMEDFVGTQPPTLESLRGGPVVLFLWAEWCGDCKSQADLLARARKLYDERGLKLITVTRYYQDEPKRAVEKEKVKTVWHESYQQVGDVPMLLSTSGMERYGASSTPTYVFIDRTGKVTDYLPYRLTEAEFDRRVAKILK